MLFMTKWIWLMLSLSSNQTIKVHFLSLFPKNYSLEPVKYSRHAQYYKVLFLLCYAVRTIALWSQGSRRANWFKMATRKRARWAEVFYRNVERGLRLQTEKIRQKIAEKMDQGKFYATEESAWLFERNHVIQTKTARWYLFTSDQNIIIGLIWKPSLYWEIEGIYI